MRGEGKFFTTLKDDVPTFMPGSMQIMGELVDNTTAGTTTNPILVTFRDRAGDIIHATGLEVPTDATAGYAKGCLYIDRNVAAGTTGLYVNVGTAASCNFDAVQDAP